MSKSIFVLLSCAFCVLVSIAQAQSTYRCPLPTFPTSCNAIYWGGTADFPNLPAGTVCCNPTGAPFDEQCVTPRRGCIVPNTANDICLSCLTAGQPINLSTGNTFIVQSDISIPGLGGGLSLTRSWNSILPAIQATFPAMFGTNWRSTYEERLIFNSSDLLLKYARSDGSVWSFGVIGTGPSVFETVTPGNDTTTITQSSQAFTMLFKSGEKRTFAPTSGLLLSIIDRNGNTTQLAYDSQSRLATITDAASRHLTFNYVSNSSNLVSSVTSDAGITYSYSYDNQGRLTQVTKPDNTTISFQYDTNSHITAVLDTNGKVLESHTYDALGRGLTSSRANGVDGVTVTYPQ